mgnify:FL=1
MVLLREDYRGTRGGTYYYVVEDRAFRHISKYAAGKSEDEDVVYWEVPVRELKGKPILMISFSNSGYGFASEHAIEDFVEGRYGALPDFDKSRWHGNIVELARRYPDRFFELEDPEFESMVEEYRNLFAKMVEDVMGYSRSLGFTISFVGHAARTEEAFSGVPTAPLYACASVPGGRERSMCLDAVDKWIYQIWTLKLAHEALDARGIARRIFGEAYWLIEQGSPWPTSVFETPRGPFTAWLEFQFGEEAHLLGRLTGRREHVRPDIVVVKGAHESTRDVRSIDLLIECKHNEPRSWEKDVETQLPSYIVKFRPHVFILASLKRLPESMRGMIERQMRIKVVDDLHPGNDEKVREFEDAVQSAFTTASP